MRKTYLLLSLALIVATLLSACQPAAATTPPAAAVPTDSPTQPKVTEAVKTTPEAPVSEAKLVIWDQFYRGVESEVIDKLNKEFEEAHPGVTLERVSKVQEDLSTTVKLALSQEDGPDVAQVNQGRSDMGAMVQAGLLLPLNDYAVKYQWNERFSTSVSSRNSFTADGKAFGEGNLYGVSPTAEVVGVYYNKGFFEENGWKVPETFADFEKLLAEIKAKGMTPVVFGDLDGWPGIHEFSSVQHVLVDGKYINDFTYGVNNVSFDIEQNRETAEIMQDWVDKKYFTDGFMGIGYDDSAQLFKTGQGAMMITGSWLSGELTTDADQKFGFFLMPQQSADKPQLAIGGVGIPYSIRKTTKNPDLAAEYLDWMVSPRAAQLWAEASFVPAMPLPADFKIEEGSLFGDTVNAWNTINQDNGVGHYIDWATPTFYDTITAELQKLFGKEINPATFTANVEKDYSAFLASQK